ncbi:MULTISPECIES: DUF732 domain-containing protein [Corynebacterium]|uniref:Uncharacterized protein n=1 Tax=Corynebacterium hadale TaxID=2026255 RepID=A0A269PF65_9CORY|nr:DUF732 domain-containing protein [Corynebacterium hadale]PAJ70747.1 hypothetical protein CIG21_03470 [Corynebacterium hadale]WKC61092.1 hypothetical protein CHAD_11270 [Corynebacterium hadale]
MRRLGALCLATLTLSLAACSGSTTVDGEDAKASASAEQSSSAPAESSTAAPGTTRSEATSSKAPAAQSGSRPEDQPAQEVTSVPQQASGFTAQEETYLEQLRQNGLNVEGVEDQLTATGRTVCSDDIVTRDAVAGQLVAQRRTDMDPAALGTLIADTARANLC